jgi:hypothetical protein
MKITLSPIASDKTTEAQINNLVLTIDGIEYDLNQIPIGGHIVPDENSPFIGNVTREEVTIKYFYDSLKAESNQSMDWSDYTFEITDGIIPSPIKWKVIA